MKALVYKVEGFSPRSVRFECVFMTVHVCAPRPRSLSSLWNKNNNFNNLIVSSVNHWNWQHTVTKSKFFHLRRLFCSAQPSLNRQLGRSQRGPARLGMKRHVHNLCAGMLIFESKGQLPFHHGRSCGIFSALQMFMNNVCGQTPGWGWGRRDSGMRERGREGGKSGVGGREGGRPDELHVGGIWQAAWSFVIIPKF